MTIRRAHVVEAEKFSALATKLWRPFVDDKSLVFRAHPDAFRFEPQGSRVHIAMAPMPEKLGSIWVPNEQDNHNGLGIIFAVGPEVYDRVEPAPGAPAPELNTDDPAELLYRQVMLKKYAGTPLAFDAVRGTDFYDNIITCTLRDILAIDFPENRPTGAAVDSFHNMLGRQLEADDD